MTATLGQFPPVRRSGVNDAGILRGGQHQGRSTCVAVRGGDAVCIAHFSERVITGTVCVRTGKSCPVGVPSGRRTARLPARALLHTLIIRQSFHFTLLTTNTS